MGKDVQQNLHALARLDYMILSDAHTRELNAHECTHRYKYERHQHLLDVKSVERSAARDLKLLRSHFLQGKCVEAYNFLCATNPSCPAPYIFR
jgi:hypothetical protein